MNAGLTAPFVRICPRRSIWSVDWRGIVDYRDLLWILVRRDFVAKYKQTILGPAWMVIQPLATTIVFTAVFAKVANISTNEVPPILFYMSGLLAWNLFSQVLSSCGSVFQANAHLFGKVYFPRVIVPLANAVTAFIPFLIQLLLFLAMVVIVGSFGGGSYHPVIRWEMLLFPFFALQAAIIGLGSALIVCSLTAIYRDLQHLLAFLTVIWMYLTPVIIPVSALAEKWPQWMWLVNLNPMTVPVEGMRWSLLNAGSISIGSLLISWGIALLLLLVGFLWFNQIERSYVDRA